MKLILVAEFIPLKGMDLKWTPLSIVYTGYMDSNKKKIL